MLITRQRVYNTKNNAERLDFGDGMRRRHVMVGSSIAGTALHVAGVLIE
jgi:hypothetical protein